MYKVLIIEDEPIIRQGLLTILPWKDLNCRIVGEVDNGIKGLEAIKETHPDIVLLDLNIPLMDGLEILEATHKTQSFSTIIVSGSNSFENAQRAMEYGAIRFISKPISRQGITQAIEDAIQEQKDIRLLSKYDKNESINQYIFEPLTSTNTVVDEMLEYLHTHYGSRIQMQDFVDNLNYSDTFLNQKFKEVTGITFNKYLNQYRVHRAVDILLRHPKMPIKDVSFKCGFSDVKYFANVFKKTTGLSPRSFLNHAKETTTR